MQDVLHQMNAAGLGVASISYDSESTLKNFAKSHKIEYPMLSDGGSNVIREFGILNSTIPKDSKYYGIPFPGDYVIGSDGIVREKYFLADYQTRPTASQILLSDFNIKQGNASVTINAEDVRMTLLLSNDKVAPGQELGTDVSIDIAPGWHIYGEPLPRNYRATSLVLSGDSVAHQSLSMPPAKPLELKALGETLPVYQGMIRAKGTILITSKLEPGRHRIQGILKFQECNDTICKLPQEVSFAVPITVEPLVPKSKN